MKISIAKQDNGEFNVFARSGPLSNVPFGRGEDKEQAVMDFRIEIAGRIASLKREIRVLEEANQSEFELEEESRP
jgi:hypothetical protein